MAESNYVGKMVRTSNVKVSLSTCFEDNVIAGARRLLLVAFAAVSAIAGTVTAQQRVERFQVRVERLLTVGNDEQRDLEYLFGRPVSVNPGPGGSIFVADQVSMNIRQFDRHGEFVRSIGSRGRGPGEFVQIRKVYVSDDLASLYVVDGANRRISRFETATGELLTTTPFDYHGSPAVDILPDGRHAMMFVRTQSREGTQAMPSLTLLDPSGRTGTPVTYSIPEAQWNEDDVVRMHLLHFPGSLLALNDGSLLYAPHLYDGRVFEIGTDDRVKLRRVLDGILNNRRLYEPAPPPRDGAYPDAGLTPLGSDEPMFYRFPCQSMFLFEIGKMFGHIVFCDIDGRRQHAVEFYDQRGDPVGLAVIEEWSRDDDNNTGYLITDVNDRLEVFGYKVGDGTSTVAFVERLVPDTHLRDLLGIRADTN